jgi:predicted nucleic acid-binding Zn ribbon protein
MRRSNESTMAEAISMLLKAYKLEDGCNRIRVLRQWEKIMGPQLAKYTRELHFRNGEVFVRLDSAPLRNELSLSATKLIDALNEGFPTPIVKSIRFS